MSTALRAVVFDVDFTLVRPGPDLGPEGYRRLGARHGLELDPARYAAARAAAAGGLVRHPELDHDEEAWVLFTERIIRGMGGTGDTHAAAVEMTAAWNREQHFELYGDALPAVARLRRRGLRVGLLSNTSRDLPVFAAHHGIDADAVLTSHAHGKQKPHEAIFHRMLELLDVTPPEAAMVGDTLEDDVEGARAIGMRAVLVDRERRYPAAAGGLADLTGLDAALGFG